MQIKFQKSKNKNQRTLEKGVKPQRSNA